MIQTVLKLVSDKSSVSGIFPETGILYQCVDADGIALCDEPRGTVVSTFIRMGRKILMAGLASEGGSGIAVQSLVKGQTVSVGLCTYRVQLSRRVARPSKRVMVVLGVVCAALVAGVVMLRLFGVARRFRGVVQPIVAESREAVEERSEEERLDLLIKLDEGRADVQVIDKTSVSSGADSREAFQLYERGLSLFDAGDHAEAVDELAAAKEAANKLPIVPSYMRMIDEGIARARTAIEEERAMAVAEARASIDRASAVSPGESLKIIAKARTKLTGMQVSDDDFLKSALDDLERMHRSSISGLLARAHTLERLEGCRAAEGAYRETLKTYGSDDKLLAQEIESALNHCGGGQK